MSGRENRRTVRILLKEPLKVIMGSIGSTVRYDLMSKDVSNKGFFLEFEKPGRFPFTPSSIMEIWMELGGPDKRVFFNGKMARVVYPSDPEAQRTGPGIAVKIVQIEPEDEKKLIDFLEYKLSINDAEVT
ncbi:MAG: PilZ domain-containing protein [Oligoflexales bacterium]|nr:PilZ domain-containing protein [Oligoflexales bacterium]